MEIMVVKEFTFDSAHYLPAHAGKCKNLHGHTYRLQIGITGPIDPVIGMVVDFAEMKNLINEAIIKPLDHSYLNDKFPFPPTAENMVIWIVKKLYELSGLSPILWPKRVSLVRLYETPTSYAEWTERVGSYDDTDKTAREKRN